MTTIAICNASTTDWTQLMADPSFYSTAAWQRLRRAKLAETPLCEDCEAMGRLVLANTVDHRIAVSQGGPRIPTLAGLASLCPPCHSAKTARSAEAGAVRTRKPRRGCNHDGTPLDRRHPWASTAKPIDRLDRSPDENSSGLMLNHRLPRTADS